MYIIYYLIGLQVGKVGEYSQPSQIVTKYPQCHKCKKRFDRIKGPKYNYDGGKICIKCYYTLALSKQLTPPQKTFTLSSPQIVTPPSSSVSSPSLSSRTKRPYDTLSTTQRWKRRKQARLALKDIDIPVQALVSNVPPPAALIHLPTSVREQIRTIAGLHIPSEKTMIQCKEILASTHGCKTATLEHGAYKNRCIS
jgi:hypothetical protein